MHCELDVLPLANVSPTWAELPPIIDAALDQTHLLSRVDKPITTSTTVLPVPVVMGDVSTLSGALVALITYVAATLPYGGNLAIRAAPVGDTVGVTITGTGPAETIDNVVQMRLAQNLDACRARIAAIGGNLSVYQLPDGGTSGALLLQTLAPKNEREH
jgi:hypothetical protein